MVGQNDITCLGMKPSVRTLIQEQSLLADSRQLLGHHSSVRVSSLSYQQRVVGVATNCCDEPVPGIVFHTKQPQLLSHNELTRQSGLADTLSLVRNGQTEEALGYLLPFPGRPDLESEKHDMNQIDY